jgi:hypothetical protein
MNKAESTADHIDPALQDGCHSLDGRCPVIKLQIRLGDAALPSVRHSAEAQGEVGKPRMGFLRLGEVDEGALHKP